MTAIRATAPRTPLGRRFGLLMGALLLSSLGNGLCFPFTSIYISQLLGLGGRAAGGYFIAMAAASFAAALAGGPLADRGSPHRVGALGGAALAVGYALLAPAGSVPLVLASGACVGAGFGLFYASIVGIVDTAVPESGRRSAFAIRHIVNNAGIGLGSVAAGLALHGAATPVGALRWLYLANGLAALPLIAVILGVRPRTRARPKPEERAGSGGGPTYRALLRARPMALLILAQALFAIVGFTQIEATVPLLMHDRMAVTLGWVSTVVAANSFALIALQPLLRRRLERLPETVSLAAGPVLWTGAFGCGLGAALAGETAPAAVRYGLLLAFAVIFAAGELMYSSAFYPLLLRWSGEEAVGRASALASLAWNLGTASGPPIGLFVVANASATGGWLALALGAAAAFTVAAALRSRTTV
ncbi:MFS transporter [Streptomyces rapamycinicus]|uniref:MFS transporter n=2 Tax=Streptomyces rapamycinicus TaxID=1226757 RepID=A0A0A0NK23_STRRN|nr:MFS transporter [Streptomyces rapamycinicus]AGP57551.1 MFS transporter [Streptomyces rapamycinicus NRRL 5491]MBB4785211.1 MFS family permease [Streptomyces rapamycinicus]RLV79317.1 MFS transporter [Streptomyces rapamycinicus NRRL 5491]UTO65421.1 MFS transporter [Streptomyces rapamycinicus]UTP33377.1 MFS transporter [Streptomyces rapamycinicus NRRL 5491]